MGPFISSMTLYFFLSIAKHLFGFGSWKDTVYKLHALFNVLPPSEIPTKTNPVSIFEQYLMGLVGIHCRMMIQSIARTEIMDILGVL